MDNLRVLVCANCGLTCFFQEMKKDGNMFPFSMEQSTNRVKGPGTRHDAARCPHCMKYQMTDIGSYQEVMLGSKQGVSEQA